MRPSLETVQPVLMSRDVSASINFFEKLGFTLEGQDVAEVTPTFVLRRAAQRRPIFGRMSS
jgi:5-enolpyruvylshikimate-3-phosphate synthase